MIYVVATTQMKPETRAEFIAAATACIKETRKEPGNIAYDLHESVTDPRRWCSSSSGRMRRRWCRIAPPKIEVITPANVTVR